MRTKTLWNDGWSFEKEGVKSEVALPHTWNAADGQTGPELYYRGECIYRKKFATPKLTGTEQLYIEFEGVNSSASVKLNGTKLVRHDGGYSTFRANLTEHLKKETEENLLEVFVDNAPNDRVYPQRADFTFYGGIYRNVNLLCVQESHFDLDYYGGNGFLITPQINGNDAEITFETYSVGAADKVVVEVADTGTVELALEQRENGRIYGKGTLFIPNVHKWDGLDDPFLYKASAKLYQNGEVLDEAEDNFGCREYHFDTEKGFFLNGRRYPLHGVSRHQDRMDVGNALTKEMHEEDMELILSMGANSIRLAHYQHDRYFYELCDRKGVIVWAEIPYITVHMDNGRENTISQMKELIVQNYNHPSIICWALSNEISLQGVTEDLLENHRILNDLVHTMDKTRVSAMANLFLLETDSPLVTLPDIRGYNLYYGWYVGDMADNDMFFDEFHAKYPDVVIGLTEYGADSVISLQSPKPEKGDYTESYQALYHEHMLEMFAARPYLWGTYVWNMFEFAAAGRDEAGDPGKNHKGLITFDRKQKKDAFYIYKAWWSDEKFVHLCGRRYRDRLEPETEIKVYSNCDSVALYVDGVFVEEKTGSHVFTFRIPITGVHQIKAVSGVYEDTMEIQKVDKPNPAYFMSPEKVKNWFEEPEVSENEKEGFLSIDSTMGEIEATEEGRAFMEQMMGQMAGKAAGGMGAGVEIPQAMKAMIARQPLRKLIAQGGMELTEEQIAGMNAMLNKIPKAKKE